MKNVQEMYEQIEKINLLNISQEQKDAFINSLLYENGMGISTLQGLKQFLLKEVVIGEPTSFRQSSSGEDYPSYEASDFVLSSEHRPYGVFKIHTNIFIPVKEEIDQGRFCDLYCLRDSFTKMRITNFFKNSRFNKFVNLPWDNLDKFEIHGDDAYAVSLIDLLPLQAIYRTMCNELFVTQHTMYSLVDKTNEFLARNPNFIEKAFTKRRTK